MSIRVQLDNVKKIYWKIMKIAILNYIFHVPGKTSRSLVKIIYWRK